MPGKFGDTDASSVLAPHRTSCNDTRRISCFLKHPASRFVDLVGASVAARSREKLIEFQQGKP